MPKLLISTVVDESYQFYMPLFLYCLQKSYPEYHVKIFTHGKIEPHVREAMKQIHTNYKLVPDVFKGWAKHKYAPVSWRFLVPIRHYQNYEYVYIGDIDLFIFREKVTLLNYHLNEMGETGLCYSNSTRHPKHWRGEKSFTGLHFASIEWFEKTEEIRRRYAEQVKKGRIGHKREFDGHMLYMMTWEAGLGICPKVPLIDRHHGLHLGSLRLFQKEKKIMRRLHLEHCRKWLALREDPIFAHILGQLSVNLQLSQQIRTLDEYCRRKA